MVLSIRRIITENIACALKCEKHVVSSSLETRKAGSDLLPEIHLNLGKLKSTEQLNQLAAINYGDKVLKTTPVDKKLIFKLDPDFVTQETLTSSNKLDFEQQKKIIVEFSSPNIAKPFHVGHLRSTIIGNFIGNIFDHTGNDVTTINYLGDWGTQFGLLQVGVELSNLSDEEIRVDPIKLLYKAYVLANAEASKNPAIHEKARSIFTELEANAQSKYRKRWETFREYTLEELQRTYHRLGISFDEYHWESQYSQRDIQATIDFLNKCHLLKDENDGRKVVEIGDRRVPIIKSDGSTLYLARDVAAIFDRFDKFNFDQMVYVVDNSQSDHFKACFETSEKANSLISGKLKHIKFGRIKGMSTRSGNTIFLKDLLDEARDKMAQRQMESPTTKIDPEKYTPDILGMSAVIVNDLKQRRQRDYDFSWDKALQMTGDTGIKLQYTHCRLTSLLRENSLFEGRSCDEFDSLTELEALNLIVEIAKFQEVIEDAQNTLEACILVNYLFGLCNTTSKALKTLYIKHEHSEKIQLQRFILFKRAKAVLNEGMVILGVQPLDQM